MEFGPISIAGLIVVLLMLVPNLICVIRFPNLKNQCSTRAMNLLEQIGRYASMVLMFLPLGVWKFGFPSVEEMLIYVFGNAALLLAYWVIWIFYFRNPMRKWAIALAVIPVGIFFLSGVTLRHWLLVVAAILFGIGHIYVTDRNHR